MDQLTGRELQVLTLMAQGMSNRQIGLSCGISEDTVKSHVKHILRKLGTPNRTTAVRLAEDQGLLNSSGQPASTGLVRNMDDPAAQRRRTSATTPGNISFTWRQRPAD